MMISHWLLILLIKNPIINKQIQKVLKNLITKIIIITTNIIQSMHVFLSLKRTQSKIDTLTTLLTVLYPFRLLIWFIAHDAHALMDLYNNQCTIIEIMFHALLNHGILCSGIRLLHTLIILTCLKNLMH